MNQKTMRLTMGAMATAIFGLMLLLNRQTGNLFEELFLFIYPVPMVAFAAVYGLRSAFPALIAMSLLSVFLGDFLTIFYAVSQAVIGLIFGGLLYRKTDTTKVLFVVMILSVVMNLVDILYMGFISGIDINTEVEEWQEIMGQISELTGTTFPETFLSAGTMMTMILISMVIMGILQGFVVYELSILILRRLHFPVPKLKPIYLYAPPKWSGIVAAAAFVFYYFSIAVGFGDEAADRLAMALGILGLMYLICFGFIGGMFALKVYVTKSTILCLVLCLLALFIFPFAMILMGFIYLSTGFHDTLLQKISSDRKTPSLNTITHPKNR